MSRTGCSLFELPETAREFVGNRKSGADGKDFNIFVDLNSEFATAFFGEEFVAQYKAYVTSTLSINWF